MDTRAVQRRTLRVLFISQIITGVGIAIGGSVGAAFSLFAIVRRKG